MMDLEILESKGKGRGVFAKKKFRKGEIIEICSIIVVPKKELLKIDKTVLYHYYFSWKSSGAIALGYGSLYNHSYSPNANYVKNIEAGSIEFIAIKEIKAGEEITTNYNGNPADLKPLWFNAI